MPAPGVGAVCGPCPTGYTGDGLKCFGMSHEVSPVHVLFWSHCHREERL